MKLRRKTGLAALVSCLLVSLSPAGVIRIEPQDDSNIVHLKISDYPGEIFEVFFPEVVHADDRSLLGPDNKAKWKRIGPGGWVTTYLLPGVGQYSIKLVPRGDEIDMEWRVRNSSGNSWNYVAATADFIFSKAPNFHDPALERTYLFIDGEWAPLKGADRSDGNPLWQWYVVKGYRPCQLMGHRPHPKDKFGFGRDQPELGLAAVVSKDGRMIVGQAFEKVQYFVQNVARGCIHPAVHLGDMPPGKEAVVRGKVYFLRGSLEDLLRRYRRDFPSGP